MTRLLPRPNFCHVRTYETLYWALLPASLDGKKDIQRAVQLSDDEEEEEEEEEEKKERNNATK